MPGVLAAIDVDPGSFLAIVTTAAVASATVLLLGRWVRIPVVVFELVLGIVIGPHVLHFADSDDFIKFFSNLGLGLLFFFAGYEIDFDRIRGRPLRLAALGWGISLALAYSIGGLLAWAGVVVSLVYTGSAMATTAIGTLIPILTDAGELRTRFGTYLLGAGAMGEFGPILLITLVLSGSQPLHEAAILIGFVALAVGGAVGVIRLVPSSWAALERSLESSNQLAIRLAVVLVFALVALASELGLDILLGGFAAGIILRVALRGREVAVFESKLVAIGYGFLIPFFFIYSGMTYDLPSLETTSALLKLPMFLVLFLVIRGLPALVLYRGLLDRRDRLALAFYSSVQLPLVVAITSIAVDDGDMRTSTAAALVGAAILSTLIYPLVGLKVRGDRPRTDIDQDVERELEREGYAGQPPSPEALPST